MHPTQALLALSATTAGLMPSHSPSIDEVVMPVLNIDEQAIKIGSDTNYWRLLTPHRSDSATITYDLTRCLHLPTTSPVAVPFLGKRRKAIIEPSRTAFVIVDMQEFFLNEDLVEEAGLGRAAVKPTVEMVKAVRDAGGKVLWVNWGVEEGKVEDLPPGLREGFAGGSHDPKRSFCSEMGTLSLENGTRVDMGKKLCRGSWNARPYGELYPLMLEGVEKETDRLFHKNRQSGFWSTDGALHSFLQDEGITTLLFGGVNSDQCVYGTLMDAYFRGYDVVYVQDCAGTTSPGFAEEMVRYNAGHYGFLANSTDVIQALRSK